jgi:hypothetical protein
MKDLLPIHSCDKPLVDDAGCGEEQDLSKGICKFAESFLIGSSSLPSGFSEACLYHRMSALLNPE